MTTIAPEREPRWGLGEVGIGLAASLVLSTLVGGLIMSLAGWKDSSEIPMWGLGLMQIPLWAGYLGAVLYAGSKGDGIVADFGARVRPLDVPIGLAIGIVVQLVVLRCCTSRSSRSRAPTPRSCHVRRRSSRTEPVAPRAGCCSPCSSASSPRSSRSCSTGPAVALDPQAGRGPLGGRRGQLGRARRHAPAGAPVPGLLVFGLVSGTLAVRSGRLGPSVFAHIGFNMTTVVLLYLEPALSRCG